jgi:uncharacterized protein (UPF0335 family)
MVKKKKTYVNYADLTPDELGEVRKLITEFMTRVNNVDNEIEQLKEDRKELVEEYSDRLDMKTLQAALRVLKIQRGVEHKHTFELFVEALTDPST